MIIWGLHAMVTKCRARKVLTSPREGAMESATNHGPPPHNNIVLHLHFGRIGGTTGKSFLSSLELLGYLA